MLSVLNWHGPSFVSSALPTADLPDFFLRWIDPAGAIVISIILIYLWGSSAIRKPLSFCRFCQIMLGLISKLAGELFLLSGVAAPKEIQQLVIYKAMTVRVFPRCV